MYNFNDTFYPTPIRLINKMLDSIDFKYINSVLEPSAGKGDLVQAVMNKIKYSRYSSRDITYDIDTIELDQNLQYILLGKNYRIVHDDFLTYNSYKRYDLVVMNPPFSNGEKHLLKAIQLQESGGQIVCLLNAETLRNPYSNIRKDLINKLEQYSAEIEYIPDAFLDAERKTYVEVALIKIDIPKNINNSIILDELRKEEQHREESTHNSYGQVVNADFIKGIIERYNFEVKAGLKLIAEYNALKPFMLGSFKDDHNKTPVLSLAVSNRNQDGNTTLENDYIKQIRMKYWRALFTSDEFMGLFTSNLRQKYYNKINELKDYDFSLFNIYTIRQQLNKEMIQGVEDTILELFEELSHKHHWHDETSKNIHYYNGWKTNTAYKINKKVIIPLNGFRDLEYSWGRYEPSNYKVVDKLTDIEKVFNYLDGGITEELELREQLKFAESYGETKKIETKYFLISFFKKGTCHLEFKNMELLHKFNLYGSQRKGWLPPSYGKKSYNSMTPEEKKVVNEFEGQESYNKVMSNRDYYIVETSKLLMLPA